MLKFQEKNELRNILLKAIFDFFGLSGPWWKKHNTCSFYWNAFYKMDCSFKMDEFSWFPTRKTSLVILRNQFSVIFQPTELSAASNKLHEIGNHYTYSNVTSLLNKDRPWLSTTRKSIVSCTFWPNGPIRIPMKTWNHYFLRQPSTSTELTIKILTQEISWEIMG